MKKSENYIKLKGNLKNTSSTVEILDNGSLSIEFYDYSEEAQNRFGNDVAYTIIIDPNNIDKMLNLLENKIIKGNRPYKNRLILELIENRFSSYFELQEWLIENHIPFKKEFDGWA